MYGIIGDPVRHSLSPLIQARFAAESGIDAVYVPFPVPADRLYQAVDGLWALSVQGFNVTIPHKEALLPLTQSDQDARTIGAVNTVKRGPDGWLATNTDWQGFVAAVRRMNATAGRALVFGAGGTARAVVHALAHMGYKHVDVCNRSPSRLEILLEHVSRHYAGIAFAAVPWQADAVRDAAMQADLLANTTSIGLHGEASFAFELCGRGVALDAMYCADGETPFVQAAKRAGLAAMDGLYMLVAQGAASFHHWHGYKPDVEKVIYGLEQELGRGPVSAAPIGQVGS